MHTNDGRAFAVVQDEALHTIGRESAPSVAVLVDNFAFGHADTVPQRTLSNNGTPA